MIARILLATAAATALASAATSPAMAAAPKVAAKTAEIPATLDGGDIDGFVAALQDAGYRAKLKIDDDGDRYIESAASGSSFTIHFIDCEGEAGCKSVRFLAWWPKPDALNIATMNEWNDGYRMARATIDSDNDIVLDYYHSLVGGVTTANFLDNFDWWTILVADFRGFMDDKKASADPAKADVKGVSTADEGTSG
ncbi:Putative sensory transduction regulator [Sphingomonas laterariae]|uniref:Putative sensory transduction regulator n=1 Tax=Edaphosphingomonas laterariae TaxID=861865 RepID=A0A239H6E6_9SPHN|nr:YbjN domain-containing protein [Sphingomonas laterariae]SNS76802.1 Putative sensory transduction regulator [Sphingomonas laterariae]